MPLSDMHCAGILYDTGYTSNKTTCLGKCCGVITAIGLLLLVILLPSSLEKVGSTESALAYDAVWATLEKTVLTEGLKIKPTFGTLLKWPTEYQEVSFSKAVSNSGGYTAPKSYKSNDEDADKEQAKQDSESEYKTMTDDKVVCNSMDGIKIELECTFQFVPDMEKMYELTMKYKDFTTYSALVRLQARSAIRHACGRSSAQEFQTERAKVVGWMNDAVRTALDTKFYAEMKLLQLKNVERPALYQTAVEAKETARSDIDLAGNERDQAITIARTRLDKANQVADATLDTAYAQANVTVRYAKSTADALLDKYRSYKTSYAAATITHKLTPEGTLAYFGTMMVGDKAGPKQTIQLPAFGQVDYTDDVALENA